MLDIRGKMWTTEVHYLGHNDPSYFCYKQIHYTLKVNDMT